MKKRYKTDPIIKQLAKGFAETTKRATSPVVKIVYPDAKFLQQGEILYFNPYVDPVNFIRKPFGTGIREQMTYHLSRTMEHVAAITILCDKYPWLLSKEDLDYLNDCFFRVNSIRVRKKDDH